MKGSTLLLWVFGSFTAVVLLIVAGLLIYYSSFARTQGPSSETTFVVITEEVEAGRAIFYGEKEIEGFVPCAYCHQITARRPRSSRAGPNMINIANRAEEAVPGVSAAEYLRQAILNPNAHISKRSPPNVMFQRYGKALSQEEIDQLVAFLLTLRGRNVIQVRVSDQGQP